MEETNLKPKKKPMSKTALLKEFKIARKNLDERVDMMTTLFIFFGIFNTILIALFVVGNLIARGYFVPCGWHTQSQYDTGEVPIRCLEEQ